MYTLFYIHCSLFYYFIILLFTCFHHKGVVYSQKKKKYASHAQFSYLQLLVAFEVKHILLQHQKRVLYDVDEEGYQRINIRRSCL